MSKLPVHQPGVHNIDRVVNDGWTCVGNRFDQRDAVAIAGKEAALTGVRHRVCAPGGEVIFDSARVSPATAAAQSPTLANAAARALNLNYATAVNEFYRIEFDHVHQLAVIGDGNSAAYEWVIEERGKIVANSNVGYGMPHIALRDGLIAYDGLGDVTERVKLPS